MTLTMLPDVAAPQADGPFTGGVVVRQVEDDPEFKKWELMEPLSYRGRRDEWTVPPGRVPPSGVNSGDEPQRVIVIMRVGYASKAGAVEASPAGSPAAKIKAMESSDR